SNHREAGQITFQLLGFAPDDVLQVGVAGRISIGVEENWIKPITVANRPSGTITSNTTIDDWRMWMLHRLWVHRDIIELIKTAVEAYDLLCPCTFVDLDTFICSWSSPFVGHPNCCKLFSHPSSADTKK